MAIERGISIPCHINCFNNYILVNHNIESVHFADNIKFKKFIFLVVCGIIRIREMATYSSEVPNYITTYLLHWTEFSKGRPLGNVIQGIDNIRNIIQILIIR